MFVCEQRRNLMKKHLTISKHMALLQEVWLFLCLRDVSLETLYFIILLACGHAACIEGRVLHDRASILFLTNKL